VWLIGAMVCLLAALWVQFSVSAGNGWPHNALRHHLPMPISCHFRDCKAPLVTSVTHVSGVIASVQTFTFTLPFNTVDFVESRLLPKPATNRQQREFDSLSRSTLLPIRSTLLPECTGPKRHGRLYRLSTKSTVLNSTLSQVCTGLNSERKHNFKILESRLVLTKDKYHWNRRLDNIFHT